MTGRPTWAPDEIAALARLKAHRRGAVRRFAAAHHKTPSAVHSKLAALRAAGRVPDVGSGPRPDPLPADRFRWMKS